MIKLCKENYLINHTQKAKKYNYKKYYNAFNKHKMKKLHA